MKYFVVVLHFYQPPNQDLSITQSVLESCYLPLLRLLNTKKNFKITLNLSGSLLEQIEKIGSTEFFALVKKLIVDEKVELLNSVMYHSLLPLISSEMQARGSHQNARILERLLGVKSLVGFFPPELAVDHTSLSRFQNQVIFVSEKALSKRKIVHFGSNTLLVGNQKLIHLFRAYPNELDVQKVFHFIQHEYPKESLFILPNDAELFGHHYSERLMLLSDLLNSREITFLSIKEAITQFGINAPAVEKIQLSSWQNSSKLHLWTKYRLQKRYLKLATLAAESTAGTSNKQVKKFLDRGWSSCYFYWLSNWPWWYPDIVESGAENLIKSVRSDESLSYEIKSKAEKVYYRLLNDIWQYHWSGKVEENYKKYELSREKSLTSFSGI